MSYNEEKIIEIILAKFKNRLYQIKNKADFETFINNLTKTKVKNFIKSALEDAAIQRDQFSDNETDAAIELRAIKNYVDTL